MELVRSSKGQAIGIEFDFFFFNFLGFPVLAASSVRRNNTTGECIVSCAVHLLPA